MVLETFNCEYINNFGAGTLNLKKKKNNTQNINDNKVKRRDGAEQNRTQRNELQSLKEPIKN